MYFIDLCFFYIIDLCFFTPHFRCEARMGLFIKPESRTCPLIRYYLNFTIQSIQTGLPERLSTKTFAGCMSSRYKRLEI